MHRRIVGDGPLQSWRSIIPGLIAVVLVSVGPCASKAGASGEDRLPEASKSEPVVALGSAPGLILRRESAGGSEDAGEGLPPTGGFETSSSRSAGLVEQPGVTEAGGVMVGLSGRFRTTLVLERKTGGSTTTRCISNLPGADPGDR